MPFGDAFQSRGRAKRTNRPLLFGPKGDGTYRVEIRGRQFDRIVVAYVKTGSAKHRKQFRFLCRVNAVQANEVQTFGDYLTAYECWGSAASLDRVMSDDCVKDWHDVIDVALPFRGAGAGPEKARKPMSPLKEFRLSDPRYAADESQQPRGRYLSTEQIA